MPAEDQVKMYATSKQTSPSRQPPDNSIIKIERPICGAKYKDSLAIFRP